MTTLHLSSILILLSFIGPSAGAVIPVQDEGDPWRASFIGGIETRYGPLSALYATEAKKNLTEKLKAVWKGTCGGAYIDMVRDIPLGSRIIDFDSIWAGLTTSCLF